MSNEDPSDRNFYHMYEVDVDGNGLRQLTDGPFDDLMPCYLPDGGIAFMSTRRKGYARCFGGQFSTRWDVYTLHRMDGDGSNIRTLSFHDTNEWFPTVSNTGHILYARWDYIDRDAVTHQNLWASRPDGTNPIAVWGNATPTPHCTFQLQPIPGSTKIIFTASAHHSIAGGSIAIVDPSVGGRRPGGAQADHARDPLPRGRKPRHSRVLHRAVAAVGGFLPGRLQPLSAGLGAGGESGPRVGNLPAGPLGQPRVALPRSAASAARTPVRSGRGRCRRCLPSARAGAATVVDTAGEMVVADVYQGLGDVPRGHDQAAADRPDLPQDDEHGQPSADRHGRRGERPGRAGHRAGRAGRLGTVPGPGGQADPVPGAGRRRLRLPDDAVADVRATRREGLVRRLSRTQDDRAPCHR